MPHSLAIQFTTNNYFTKQLHNTTNNTYHVLFITLQPQSTPKVGVFHTRFAFCPVANQIPWCPQPWHAPRDLP